LPLHEILRRSIAGGAWVGPDPGALPAPAAPDFTPKRRQNAPGM